MKDSVSEVQDTCQKYERYMAGLVKFSYIGMVGKVNWFACNQWYGTFAPLSVNQMHDRIVSLISLMFILCRATCERPLEWLKVCLWA